MLEINNLHASIGETPILRGLSLSVGAGEVHAIMGPNGSGKSTLALVIAGHDDYIKRAAEELGKDPGTVRATLSHIRKTRIRGSE